MRQEQAVSPIRTCVGCRNRAPKTELTRLVLQNQTPVWDPAASQPGRGAYLHLNFDCVQAAIRRGGLNRAFRRTIDPAKAEAALNPSIP